MLKPFWNKTFKSMTRWKIHGSERCTDPVMMLLTTGPSQVSLWMLCGCEAVLDRCTHHTHFALRIQNRSVANIRKDLRSKAAKCSLLRLRKPWHTPLHGVLSFGTIHVHTVEHICFVNFCVQTNQSWCQQVCMLIGSKKKNGDTRYMSIPGSNQFKRTFALVSQWVDLATQDAVVGGDRAGLLCSEESNESCGMRGEDLHCDVIHCDVTRRDRPQCSENLRRGSVNMRSHFS